MSDSAAVYLQHCNGYNVEKIKDFFETSLAKAKNFSPRTAKVFVKPNLISAGGIGLACTDPKFLLALGEWLLDHGATVAVGDSPAFGKASNVLKSLGIAEKIRSRGITIVDFHKVSRKKLGCGVDIGIAAEPLTYDYFVNAPKLKAHSQMYVTMAIKNVFGIVVGMQKSMLHMRHGGEGQMFCKIILDLYDLLPPHLSVIDGIVAMHEQGPIHGNPLDLGCLGFSEDPVALETSLLQALRLDHQKSPLWCEAKARGLPGTESENIVYPLLSPALFHNIQFHVPEVLAPIRFNPLRFLRNSFKRTALRITKR